MTRSHANSALVTAICLVALCAPPGDAAMAQTSDLPEEALPRAQALIRDRNYTIGSTPHFRVHSDDPRLDTKKTAELLESFRQYFEADWAAFPGRKTDDAPAQFFLFYSRFKYSQLGGPQFRETGVSAPGHYNTQADIVAIHTDTVDVGNLPDLLIHETTHQLTHITLLGPGTYGSPWLMEGLAEYYGNMKRSPKEGFQPERFGDKGVALFRDGPKSGPQIRSDELRQYKKELSKGIAAPVEVLVNMRDPGQFLSDGLLQRYTASWMLVHFLMQGEGGRHREGFARYIAQEAAGVSGATALYEALGIDAAALQTAFEDHVKHL